MRQPDLNNSAVLLFSDCFRLGEGVPRPLPSNCICLEYHLFGVRHEVSPQKGDMEYRICSVTEGGKDVVEDLTQSLIGNHVTVCMEISKVGCPKLET